MNGNKHEYPPSKVNLLSVFTGEFCKIADSYHLEALVNDCEVMDE